MKGKKSRFERKTTRFPVHGASALLSVMTALAALPAGAQRADDNAVTAAGDAFGVTVGLQSIGLYGPLNVRGFNPAQAENLRIEGLYYDQQISSSNPFLFNRSDIRVGIAAQSYSFPSPTGIVDYKLRTPGDAALFSVLLTHGPLNMTTAEIDAQYPLVKDVLGVAVSVAHWNDFDYNYARTSENLGFSLLLRIRPDERSEILPFIGYIHNGEHQLLPIVFANGLSPLPMFNEQQLPAQDWTSWGWNQLTAGVVAKSALGSSWRLAAGVFRSLGRNSQNFNDLLLGPTAGGIADHILDVTPPLRAGSYSGDLRLTRLSVNGAHQREMTFDVRGRTVERDYGGDSIRGLGSISIYRTEHFPPPLLAFSALGLDQVRQVGVGASYNERWQGVGTLSLGVLKTEYRRTLEIPGSSGSTKRTSQVLPTASFTVDIGKHATAYASYTRGLEDSPTAPASAINRGEPVPATPTWQVDGGLRIVPRSGLELLLGGFEVHKTYFNVDAAGRYGQLGDISSRGVEGSATLSTLDGLKVVAGVVLLRPEVKQLTPAVGTGTVPVGPVPRTINVNVDYAPARWGGWAAALQWTSMSSRVVTNNDQVELPPLSMLNVGVRYRIRLFNRPCSARLDVANVTDETGLTISSLYLVVPVLRRNYTLTLATDI
ncbi:MAG TPA: TonB-dependent receptor [Steroidobacteraceae bacterium]|nr:TonB-dependent receptor [Steroidobacteraceae bacterium]